MNWNLAYKQHLSGQSKEAVISDYKESSDGNSALSSLEKQWREEGRFQRTIQCSGNYDLCKYAFLQSCSFANVNVIKLGETWVRPASISWLSKYRQSKNINKAKEEMSAKHVNCH